MLPLQYAGEYALQVGVPGGPELLILLLMLLMALPVALVVLVVLRLRGSGGEGDRVEELERRVDGLEAELEAERSSGDEARPASDPDDDRL